MVCCGFYVGGGDIIGFQSILPLHFEHGFVESMVVKIGIPLKIVGV
jgi:hypothetical protein